MGGRQQNFDDGSVVMKILHTQQKDFGYRLLKTIINVLKVEIELFTTEKQKHTETYSTINARSCPRNNFKNYD
jgi:hypothetical protein